jgi:glycosyltransferase involved in cell wall biosynthesis
LRILHLIHRSWPYHGGAERYVLEHALAAPAWGHSSTIVTTDAWDMSWMVSRKGRHLKPGSLVYEGVEIIRFPVRHPPLQGLLRGLLRRLLPGGPDRFFYPNPFVPSMVRYLSGDRGFGFVHANAMPFLLYHGHRQARRSGAGLASVPHANVGEPYRRVSAIHYFRGAAEKVLRESSFVVAQSRFEAGLYMDMGVPRERVLILGSGIDPEELRGARDSRRSLGLQGDVVLGLTAHCRDKGSLDLLAASRELWRRGSEHTLVLAGPLMPDMRSELRQAAGDVPPGRLVLTGYLRREDRLAWLASCDLLALPSRLDCFGIVLLEAWALGKPVVGCYSGAMPDLVRDGSRGFVVPFGDTETLAHRLGVLLRSPGLRRGMGERGRKAVLARHTWKAVTDRFYARLAECGGAAEARR